MSTTSVEDYLASYKSLHGEEAWRGEVVRLAAQAIKYGPSHVQYWRELTKDFEWFSWDMLEGQEMDAKKAGEVMAELLKQQMPGIKSQAQYDATLAALDCTVAALNAIFTSASDKDFDLAREALDLAFRAARKSTELTEKLEEVPEAVTSPAGDVFKKPPAQYHEREIQVQLLADLLSISTYDELTRWYAATKGQRDQIVSQSLRNELLDQVRAKKNTWCVQCRNPHFDGVCECGKTQ